MPAAGRQWATSSCAINADNVSRCFYDAPSDHATEPPSTELPTTAAPPLTVTHVVDGDTVDLSTGERLRIIGIDTPETGQCRFQEATDALTAMIAGKSVVVSPGARDDVDKYGRLLRYIDVDGVDVGLSLIQHGLAIARYDSRAAMGITHGKRCTSPPTRSRRRSARRPLAGTDRALHNADHSLRTPCTTPTAPRLEPRVRRHSTRASRATGLASIATTTVSPANKRQTKTYFAPG